MTRQIRIHLLEAKYEFIKLLRTPSYSLPTLAFPIVFYLFFGIAFGRGHVQGMPVTMATYLIASYGAFGVIGASLFGFGVSIAVERGQGWLQVKRTTPMPPSAYFIAKLLMAMLFSAIIVLALFALGVGIGGVHLTASLALQLFTALVLGSITFCALGLAVGYFAGPNSAAPLVNLIYLPMSFLSGLWVPIWMLPRFLQKFALVLPPYHLSQLALGILGANRGGSIAMHTGALAAFAIVFLFIAAAGWRRDEGKLYG